VSEARTIGCARCFHPRKEEVSRAVLLKNGVPVDRIEIIGDGVVSTLAEAKLVFFWVDTEF